MTESNFSILKWHHQSPMNKPLHFNPNSPFQPRNNSRQLFLNGWSRGKKLLARPPWDCHLCQVQCQPVSYFFSWHPTPVTHAISFDRSFLLILIENSLLANCKAGTLRLRWRAFWCPLGSIRTTNWLKCSHESDLLAIHQVALRRTLSIMKWLIPLFRDNRSGFVNLISFW